MRILLADDHIWFHSVMQLYLEEEPDFEIVGGANTVETLCQMVLDLQPDLILLDWELPGIDAKHTRRNLLINLHRSCPRLFVILLSVNTNVNCDSVCREADACVNLAEPPERLLAALHWAQEQIENASRQMMDSVEQPSP